MADPHSSDLTLDNGIVIASGDVGYVTSRSSGPGGQNVNKVETRVTLWFDLDDSASLDDGQKERIRRQLASRINREGRLRVTSQRHRTQTANRRAATERFVELLSAALAPRKRRKPTVTSKAAKRRRLENKKRRSQLKEARRRPDDG